MAERIIKSKQRVKVHGEVFTPQEIVDFMLNQPEIQEKLKSLTSTFLEPAAGEGAFLLEILRRKMQLALKMSSTIEEYEENALIALSSLYGIELLIDNCQKLRGNLLYEFHKFYGEGCMHKFSVVINPNVIKSAKTIINANMVQGDALKYTNDKGEPIIFSEWTILPKKYGIRKIQRTEHTLESILNENSNSNIMKQVETITLFPDLETSPTETKLSLKKYQPIKIIDIYKA